MGKTGLDQTRKMNSNIHNLKNLSSIHLDSQIGNSPITNQNALFELNNIDYQISSVTRESEFFKIKAHFCFQTVFKSCAKSII